MMGAPPRERPRAPSSEGRRHSLPCRTRFRCPATRLGGHELPPCRPERTGPTEAPPAAACTRSGLLRNGHDDSCSPFCRRQEVGVGVSIRVVLSADPVRCPGGSWTRRSMTWLSGSHRPRSRLSDHTVSPPTRMTPLFTTKTNGAGLVSSYAGDCRL